MIGFLDHHIDQLKTVAIEEDENQLVFQQDDAPTHFAAYHRNFLDERFPGTRNVR